MRKFKILLVIFIIILGGIFFFWEDLLDFYTKPSLMLPRLEERVTEKQILIPSPLRAEKEAPESFLTRAGVIQWTNIQRKRYGFSPLKENVRLNVSTELKVQDMFENQYFSHYSPSGEGAEDWIKSVGYEFIAIGENLALGNFENDEALVQAWMESPGHRENILNPNYQEIGVVVLKGIFEEKSTWLAIQYFGLPLSACLQLDEALGAEIEVNQDQIEELKRALSISRAKIKAIRPKRGSTYNQAIEQYNALVSRYNALTRETAVLINEYNAQVILFNECATGG